MFISKWREFLSAPCFAGKTTWWQLASGCCWNRARSWHASELVSFLVGLRTYQHSGNYIHAQFKFGWFSFTNFLNILDQLLEYLWNSSTTLKPNSITSHMSVVWSLWPCQSCCHSYNILTYICLWREVTFLESDRINQFLLWRWHPCNSNIVPTLLGECLGL